MKHLYKFFYILFLSIFFVTFYSECFSADDLVVNSGACILIDANYGKVLYEKNSKERYYPASITKVMTAILTCENCNLKDKVTISYWSVYSVPDGYSMGQINPEEVYTVEQLLNITMIASANDAAYALAEYIVNLDNPNYLKDSSMEAKASFDNSIQKFSDMMNEKAKKIGCMDTNFVNPNGIHNDNHYSTAYDLALIGYYAYSNTIIRTITSKVYYQIPSLDTTIKEYKSTNILLYKDNNQYYYPYANGLKTGFTDPAGHCMIATANKDDMNLLAVVLNGYYLEDNTPTRESDCINLFEYGFNNFAPVVLIHENDIVTNVTVFNGTDDSSSLDLICVNTLDCLIKKGDIIDVTPHIELLHLEAPIAKGQVLGKITYTIDGVNYSSDLMASNNVYTAKVMNIILLLFSIFVVLLILVIVLSLPKLSKNKH